ncbi:MAG: acyl-CoA thioesterase [Aquificae bacterium]|nr:acyl-CoA thioesterase [Aquificota bacterium]
MLFTYERRVQFYETDAQGVVHHSNYFRYLEEARGELLRSLGFPYSALREAGYEVVLLQASCSYRKPLFYDELFTVELTLTELNRFFFTFNYAIKKGGQVAAEAFTRHCAVKNGRPASLPSELTAALKRYLREPEGGA